ncbi:hypothetical protein [Hoeflea alexandrii]
MVGLHGGFDDRQYLERVKPNGTVESDELDDDLALSAFDMCDE